MRVLALLSLVAGTAIVCAAQPTGGPLLSTQNVNDLATRSLQLMEAASVATPELNRAGAPLTENARQAADNLRLRAGNLGFTYAFVTNLRAYLVLADSVPKPFPFPEEAAKQLAELREAQSRFESHFRALLDQRDIQLRSPDRDNLRRYSEANQLLGPPVPGKPRVVFMGDSITDFWRLNEYFPDRDFVNRGISGQVTGEMLGRFKADVIDLKPEAVVILAGTNDIARAVPLSTIENNFTMMSDLADKAKIKVIWASVLPISDYHKQQNPAWEMSKIRPPSQIRSLNDWLRRFCAQRGYTYVDYYAAMVDPSGMLPANLADDGLHPNSAGYRVMAPLAADAVDHTVGAVQPKAARKRPSKKSS
jgi:lysophospholipase L1-like esterase